MDDYKQPIVFLDADAVVIQRPVLFSELDCDFAAHRTIKGELLSGTLFVNYTKNARNIINHWVYEQSKEPEKWDQKVLDDCIKSYNLEIDQLPQSYTKIFDTDGPDPVIQHNQASRRLKNMLGLYPKNMNARLLQDGTFIVPRAKPSDLKLLNDLYPKVPGENRWYTRIDKSLDVRSLILEAESAYMIGKGPSLDMLKLKDFEPGIPVFCINDSVHKICELGLDNPVYTFQQDSTLEDKCWNKDAKLLLNRHAVTPQTEDKLYKIYTPEDYDCQSNTITCVVGLKILESLGVKSVTMLGFDASTNKNVAYAKCIGYASNEAGDPKRFLTHRVLINEATNLSLNWEQESKNLINKGKHQDENDEQIGILDSD